MLKEKNIFYKELKAFSTEQEPVGKFIIGDKEEIFETIYSHQNNGKQNIEKTKHIISTVPSEIFLIDPKRNEYNVKLNKEKIIIYVWEEISYEEKIIEIIRPIQKYLLHKNKIIIESEFKKLLNDFTSFLKEVETEQQ